MIKPAEIKRRELAKFWKNHTWVGNYPDCVWIPNDQLEKIELEVSDTANEEEILKMYRSGKFVTISEPEGEEE